MITTIPGVIVAESRQLCRFLFGHREAIAHYARARHAPLLALAFVFSAALARNYHKEPLLSEPWHLLGPFAASLTTGGALFLLIFLWPRPSNSDSRAKRSPIQEFRVFITLYWMTAPLAWFYAIPWEHFLDHAASVRANLWMLTLVSIWRVALIIRIISILYTTRPITVFPLVTFYAAIVTLVTLHFLDLPMIHIMGGIQLGEAEQVIASAMALLVSLSILAIPVLLIWSLAQAFASRLHWMPPAGEPARVHPAAFCIPGLACVVFIAATPFTQPRQELRHELETAFEQQPADTWIDEYSHIDADELPPHWGPPSLFGAALIPVIEKLAGDSDAYPEWMREHFASELLRTAARVRSQRSWRPGLESTARAEEIAALGLTFDAVDPEQLWRLLRHHYDSPEETPELYRLGIAAGAVEPEEKEN